MVELKAQRAPLQKHVAECEGALMELEAQIFGSHMASENTDDHKRSLKAMQERFESAREFLEKIKSRDSGMRDQLTQLRRSLMTAEEELELHQQLTQMELHKLQRQLK